MWQVKLITAVFGPALWDEARNALTTFGVRGLTECDVLAHTRNGQQVRVYRGRWATDLRPCLRVDLPAADDEVSDLVHIMRRVASTATAPDDGWVWVTPVDLVLLQPGLVQR
jgi:nitrogen regulatory protein PII